MRRYIIIYRSTTIIIGRELYAASIQNGLYGGWAAADAEIGFGERILRAVSALTKVGLNWFREYRVIFMGIYHAPMIYSD